MFNISKIKAIQEVIDELELLCIEYDAKEEVKSGCGEDVVFEIGVEYGLRLARKAARNIQDKYESN